MIFWAVLGGLVFSILWVVCFVWYKAERSPCEAQIDSAIETSSDLVLKQDHPVIGGGIVILAIASVYFPITDVVNVEIQHWLSVVVFLFGLIPLGRANKMRFEHSSARIYPRNQWFGITLRTK
jgi:hypothetical protein